MARIALIGDNSAAYINELLDIWNSGDCAVLIDWRVPFSTAVEMMREADVVECRIEKRLLDKLENIDQYYVNITSFDSDNYTECVSQHICTKFKPNYSQEEAVIIYSSGTTGKSRGIILSHYAININADSILDYMKPLENDVIYIVKTISHSSTLTGELLVALKSNMKIIVGPIIVPPRYVLRNIKKYNVTIICVNPTLLELYANEYRNNSYSLTTLRVIYVSGSILNNKIYNFSRETFKEIPIYNVYGLSEAGPRVTAQTSKYSRGNSVGKQIKNVEIVIVDDNGKILSNGEKGIIHVNTPSRYTKYVVGTEKNKSLYKNWLNTGDVGYWDSNNELHIINRIDEVIIIDSHKIYPSDLEKLILKNTSIMECVVVKIKDMNGYEFLACLYTGVCCEETDIKMRLKTKLLTYEIPHRFIHIESIPKTRNGKINLLEVKNLFNKIMEGEKNEY